MLGYASCNKGGILLSSLVLFQQGTVSLGLRGGLLTGLVESAARNRHQHYKSGSSALFHHAVMETEALNMSEEKRNRPLVVCGPSGVGKGTIIKMIVNKFPNNFILAVSCTTRSPREGEKNGKHYNFINREKFKQKISEGEFLEYAKVHQNLYGTTFKAVEDAMSTGKVCILDMDSQGVKSIKAASEQKLGFPYYVCIVPPCINALRERIRARGSESPEQLEMRLAAAMGEIEFCSKSGACNYCVVRPCSMITEEVFFFSQ